MIRAICGSLPLSDKEIDLYFLPALVNFVEFVHLLPASEHKHHSGQGGLLAHSLETCFFAVNAAKNKIFDRAATPSDAHRNKSRWILAAALSALNHDLGKPVTEVIVTNAAGEKWIPTRESLVEWLHRTNSSYYYSEWRTDLDKRLDAHEKASLDYVRRIIPPETYCYLSEVGNTEIEEQMRYALVDDPDGKLTQIVEEADQKSVLLDKSKQASIDPKFKNITSPQVRPIVDAMRALVGEGKWKANTSGARIWVTKQGCFIVWGGAEDKGVGLIRSKAVEMGNDNVPMDPVTIADLLLEGGYAERPPEEISTGTRRFWSVCPIALGKSNKGQALFLNCLKVASADLIFYSVSAPATVTAILKGIPPDDETVKEWIDRYSSLPRSEDPNNDVPEYSDYELSKLISEQMEAEAEKAEVSKETELYYSIIPSLPPDEEDETPAAQPSEEPKQAEKPAAVSREVKPAQEPPAPDIMSALLPGVSAAEKRALKRSLTQTRPAETDDSVHKSEQAQKRTSPETAAKGGSESVKSRLNDDPAAKGIVKRTKPKAEKPEGRGRTINTGASAPSPYTEDEIESAGFYGYSPEEVSFVEVEHMPTDIDILRAGILPDIEPEALPEESDPGTSDISFEPELPDEAVGVPDEGEAPDAAEPPDETEPDDAADVSEAPSVPDTGLMSALLGTAPGADRSRRKKREDEKAKASSPAEESKAREGSSPAAQTKSEAVRAKIAANAGAKAPAEPGTGRAKALERRPLPKVTAAKADLRTEKPSDKTLVLMKAITELKQQVAAGGGPLVPRGVNDDGDGFPWADSHFFEKHAESLGFDISAIESCMRRQVGRPRLSYDSEEHRVVLVMTR